MGEGEVKTIRQLFYFLYAKIIAKYTYGITDGIEINQRHYGLVKSKFRSFVYGNKSWSDITRELIGIDEECKVCAYCGKDSDDLQQVRIISQSLNIKPDCKKCEKIQAVHNKVLSCFQCTSAKQDLGLYEYYHKLHSDKKWFYDLLPRLVEKNYLMTMYHCHECAGTLDKDDLDGDGELTVLDIDYILH